MPLIVLLFFALGCEGDSVESDATETVTPKPTAELAIPRLWEDKEMGDMAAAVLNANDKRVLFADVVRWEHGRLGGYVNLLDESGTHLTRHELSQPLDPDERGSNADSGWLVVVERAVDGERHGENEGVLRRIEIFWELRGNGYVVRNGPLIGTIRRWGDSNAGGVLTYTDVSMKWWRNLKPGEASKDTPWMELTVE